jgi:hypothetical protein
VSHDIAIQDAEEGAKKRCKKHHQETGTDDDGVIDKQVGDSGVVRSAVVAGSSKHQAWPPTDNFEKLLKETCPNHAYPVKHKLKNYSMMKSFMTSGSLPRSMEVDEVLDEGDTTPFPEEDVVMKIYSRCPLLGMHHASGLSLGPQLAMAGGGRAQKYENTNFLEH